MVIRCWSLRSTADVELAVSLQTLNICIWHNPALLMTRFNLSRTSRNSLHSAPFNKAVERHDISQPNYVLRHEKCQQLSSDKCELWVIEDFIFLLVKLTAFPFFCHGILFYFVSRYSWGFFFSLEYSDKIAKQWMFD